MILFVPCAGSARTCSTQNKHKKCKAVETIQQPCFFVAFIAPAFARQAVPANSSAPACGSLFPAAFAARMPPCGKAHRNKAPPRPRCKAASTGFAPRRRLHARQTSAFAAVPGDSSKDSDHSCAQAAMLLFSKASASSAALRASIPPFRSCVSSKFPRFSFFHSLNRMRRFYTARISACFPPYTEKRTVRHF